MSEQPEGIDQQLDAGVAGDDHQPDQAPEDARQGTGDPDQTEENIRSATEAGEPGTGA